MSESFVCDTCDAEFSSERSLYVHQGKRSCGRSYPWGGMEELKNMLVEEGRSYSDVASEFGYNQSRIRQIVKESDFVIRKDPDVPRPEEVRRGYLVERKSKFELSKEWCCTVEQAAGWIREHGLEFEKEYLNPRWLRKLRIDRDMSTYDMSDVLPCGKTTIRRYLDEYDIEKDNPHKDVALLRRLNREEEMGMKEIAEHLDVTKSCISSQFQNSDIEYISHYEPISGEDHHLWIDKVQLVCEWCGDDYERTPKKAENSSFCKRECFNAHQSENWVGENNPLWKGGTRDRIPYRVIRRDLENDTWWNIRDRVVERDDYTCQKCGEDYSGDTSRLQAHHIIPVKGGGRNTDELLMSLCRSCHNTVESYTKQFTEDFMVDWTDEELPEGRGRWTPDEKPETGTKSILSFV